MEFSGEFGEWWDSLSASEQHMAQMLLQMQKRRLYGEPSPGAWAIFAMPHSSGVEASRHAHMRELRIQHEGRPYRVLYAFDPRRAAILLIGGEKTGNNRWYGTLIPVADAIYDRQIGAYLRSREERAYGTELQGTSAANGPLQTSRQCASCARGATTNGSR